MPRSLVFLIALSLIAPMSAVARADHDWQSPVKGPVVRAFGLSADRFAGGQHRGVDLGAQVGTTVRASCPGRVTFAGTVPGGGRTVSVRCGRLIATYQQLGSIRVSRGELVAPHAGIGAVGPSSDTRTRRPHVHLSARVASSGRYLDPMSLLGADHGPVPILPADRVRAGPRLPLGPAPAPAPAMRERRHESERTDVLVPRPAPAAAPVRRTQTTPLTVWLGLVAVGLGLPIGALATRRRRRREPHGHAATRVARVSS
ncbi:MAG: hypothetical protein QOG15_848 [Solirubrobacteraceae bacterium]|jgi:hypothetical protein|nr:hypothetical protein [Solirubrobacteraceae bacterium]